MTYAEIGQFVTVTTGFLLLGFTGAGVANLRFKVPGTAYFVALTLAGAVWSFGYAFELGQSGLEGFMMAARLQYLGVAFIPPLCLLLALSWIELPLARSPLFRSLLLALSLVLLSLVWTNEGHHWYYRSVEPTGTPGFALFEPGPIYYAFFVLYLATFAFSLLVLWVRRKKIVRFRQKATVIVTSNLVLVAFTVAYQMGFRPGGLDLTFFGLLPVFSILAWGLFRHDFIRIVPIAREIVIDSLDQAVLVFDHQGRLVDHNAAARWHREDFLSALAADANAQGELSIAVGDQKRTYRFRRSPILQQGHSPEGTVVLIADVTEEKQLLDRLAHQASHDALTGLANRRHFEESALSEITRAERHGGTTAVVLFDLDWFKQINDGFGHASGDKVLQSVAQILAPRLRPYDLLARVGGEEFAVLLPQTQAVEAREAAERWRAALEAFVHPDAGDRPVTASFGVATLGDLPLGLPSDSRIRLDALMGLADKALYRAKNEGRNRVG